MSPDYAINWTAVVLIAVVGLVAMAAMLIASQILSPRRLSSAKAIPYESGIEPQPFSRIQLHIHYYIFAILFLIFDVEAVFLFPWALVFLKTTPAVFYEMIIFMAVLLFGVAYAWRKGGLQWR